MLTKIITISIMIVAVILILKLLKVSAEILSFVIWVVVVASLIYLLLPWLDPYMQKVAKSIPDGGRCYGLVLESGDCFGIVK